MEFTETLERIRAEEASMQQLFTIDPDGSIGVRSRSATLQQRYGPSYTHKLAETAKLIEGVLSGRIPRYVLTSESLTTSDFPLLFADILDRSLLAQYGEYPQSWQQITRRATVNDFRDVKVYPPAWGADTRLPLVPQDTEYPETKLNEQAALSYRVLKYGQRIGFSFEAMVNDDLDQLKDIPARFARAARRTEDRSVVELYVDASGPHAALYTGANKNQVITANGAGSNNPPLSVQGLTDAFNVLANQKDENGEPILLDMAYLVVPPALRVTALTILNATEIRTTRLALGATPPNPATAGQDELAVTNWMRNSLTLIVNPYIPATATTANGNTAWFLFANPNSGREALRIAFLRGHETPEIWMKAPNAIRVGGGAVDPIDGDFDTDSITYRVRHILGVTRIDPKATVASTGAAT